jgi:4-diphosphocytidyl-2-C-methyl-D-erythritol kinase
MIIQAYAKINLGLRVLQQRKDGYHDIETIFHRVNISDDVEIEPAETIQFSSSGGDLPADESNLCLRAARLLQREYRAIRGARIRLTKRIPIGAGLGGGSSDAAATLLGLNTLWDLRLTPEDLLPIALHLGSDVPFFLRQGSAVARGRGDLLEYFPLDIPFSIVVVYPGVHISTAWAYAHLHPEGRPDPTPLKSILLSSLVQPEKMQALIHNDFQRLVFSSFPMTADISHRLHATGAFFTQLSGSGSAVFGFFMNEAAARESLLQLDKRCTAFLTPPHFIPPVT